MSDRQTCLRSLPTTPMNAGAGMKNQRIKMVRKRLVDHNALVQAETGLPTEEFLQQFGYDTFGALKIAYLHALMALDKGRPKTILRKKSRSR